VRFLIDECLPPSIARLLRAAGHHCAHVYKLGLGGQPDEQIMALADRENRSSSPPTPTSANSSPTHPC
jgi:predicted nuclease of predicted toxin-antitoxin system